MEFHMFSNRLPDPPERDLRACSVLATSGSR